MFKYIYGKNLAGPLENRIFTLLTFLLFMVLLLGNFINMIFDTNIALIIVSLLATSISFVFYLLARNYINQSFLKLPFFVLTFIFLPLSWFFNAGINGVIYPFILVLSVGLFSVAPQKYRFFVLILLLVILVGIIIIQFAYPETVLPYANESQRFTDIALSSIEFLLFLYLLVDLLIKNYTEENIKVIRINEELQQLNEELRTKNENIAETNLKLLDREKTLKNLSEFHKTILDNAAYAIISISPDGVIKSFNSTAEKMLGYSAEEVINKTTPEIFHLKSELEIRAKELSIELGEPIKPDINVFLVKSRMDLPNEYEWTYVKKSGEQFPTLLSVTAMRDSKGNITSYLGISNDISKRRADEEELRKRTAELEESEEKYRTLFEESRDALLIINNHVFVDCNNATIKLLGYNNKDELRNTHPSKLSPPFQPDGRSSFEKAEEMMNIAKENGSHRFEWVHIKANGEHFYAEVSLTIIPFQGRQIIHTAWRDITDRKIMMGELIKAKDESEKANQLKSEFLAQMSHEIRSPINSILNFTSLIEDLTRDKKNEDLENCFASIDSASKRVIRTIDSILNMSELQLGIYKTSFRDLNVLDLLEKLVNEYKKTAASKNLTLRMKTHVTDPVIHTDEYAASQIIANLIDNAIKYTEKGDILVNIADLDEKSFSVIIKDTGKGISQDYLPLLFEPFSQEEQGYTRRFDGNGLGMALVKRYCELINARISVKSKKGEGTEFEIVFSKNGFH